MHKKIPNYSTAIIGIVLLVCGIGAVWFYFGGPSQREYKALPKIASLPLEPAVFFRHYYAALDKTLSEHLTPLGLELSEVSSHPTQKDGVGLWPQKIIEITVPEQLSKTVLVATLQKALDPFKPAVTFVVLPGIASSDFSVTISISRIPSHKLKFYTYTVLNPVQKSNGRMAIIIDDMGNNYSLSIDVLAIKAALTISILPFSQYALAIAEKARSSGHEVMLHLPMEAKNGKTNKGDYQDVKGFLLTEMNDYAIATQTSKCMGAVPHIAGVNNHMGSRFTEDEKKMKIVLELVKKQRLFYIDSHTTEQSKGFKVAISMGIKAGKRDIFLDNEELYLTTVNHLEQLLMLAMSRGTAIGIGHPHPSTIHAITTMLPEFEKRGVAIVPASKLIE